MILRVRFPEREDALRGNVELVDEHENRVAIGHLEVDGPLGAGDLTAPVRFVGSKTLEAVDPLVPVDPLVKAARGLHA